MYIYIYIYVCMGARTVSIENLKLFTGLRRRNVRQRTSSVGKIKYSIATRDPKWKCYPTQSFRVRQAIYDV